MFVWGWNALEADFLYHYGIDLYDALFVDKISNRKFIVLVTGLPPDSAWARFNQNDDNYSAAILYK